MKQKILTLSLGLLLLPLLAVGIVQAQSDESSETLEENLGVEQTSVAPTPYNVTTKLRSGTVVQPDPSDSTKVIPATGDKLVAAFGIVVPTTNLPISIIESGASENRVFVSTTGRHNALVTSENGPIEAGDYLAISSLSGTLMKSEEKQELVFAKALGSFDGKNNTIGTTTLKDSDGKPRLQIGIGYLPVAIEIIKNPQQTSTEANLPEQLQRIGQAIAEKPIEPTRIYISMAIVTLSIVIALTLLIVGVRNSIISIGRNPLSKKSIFRGLLQVILSSVLVLIIGLFTVYLLLRL